MMRLIKCKLVLTFAMILTGGTSHAATSIVGDTVEIWGVAQSSGAEFLHASVPVVDPGVEYTAAINNNDIYDLDIGPTSILLNSLDDWYSPWFNSGFAATTLEIRGIDVPGMPLLYIGGVDVIFSETIVPEDNAPQAYPAFSAGNVTFTADSVILQTGPYYFPTGSRVAIDITFVPEPSTMALLTSSLLGAMILIRRLPRFSDRTRARRQESNLRRTG